MAERRKRGLGRGLGALIPDAASSDRPVDVFFSGGAAEAGSESTEEAKAPRAARTDPAASMQVSRRRKPKAGATTASTSTKTPKSTAGVSEPAPVKATPAKKKAAGSTSTKTASSAAAAKQESPAKSSGAKSVGSQSAPAKSTPTKSSPARSESKKTTGAESGASKSVAAKSAAKISANKAAPAGQTSLESPAGSAETPSAQPVEPDVEAITEDLQSEISSSDSTAADEVYETHPGVYRSGQELFDGARQEEQAPPADTTYVVNELEAPAENVDIHPGPSDVESATEDHDGGAGVESIPDTEFGEINVDLIDANPRQPRTFFDEDQLSELVHSIREIGVLQPVVVRQKPSDSERFELIMGERRLRATKDAGLSAIPAIIRYVDDNDLLRDALLENLHRAELNPLEEAAAYGQLLEDFGCTQEELSERIGRSRPQISNTLRLLRLPPLVQRRVAAGVISAGHARAILGLREPEHMEILAQRIVAEGLSVRSAEEAVVLLNRGEPLNVSRGTSRVAPQFIEVAERLGDRLDTKVNITVGKKKGKLSVEFANQDDLSRILGLLGVTETTE